MNDSPLDVSMSGSLCLPYFEERPEELKAALASVKFCKELYISGLEWDGHELAPQVNDRIRKRIRVTGRRFPNLRRLYVYGYIYDVDLMIRWKSLNQLTSFVDRREPRGDFCPARFESSPSLETVEVTIISWDRIPPSLKTVTKNHIWQVYWGEPVGVENLILTNASASDRFSDFTGLRTLTMDKLANGVLNTVVPGVIVTILPAEEIRVTVRMHADGHLYLDGNIFYLDGVPGAEFPPLLPGLPGWFTLVSPARPLRRFRIDEDRQIINLE